MSQEPELARISTGFPSEILSVSELNRSVRDLLEHRYPLLWVRGEISNFIVARSGHAYFALKDAQAQVRCVMFKNRNQQLGWQPADGLQADVQGLVTLYEPRGDFQLVVETMRRAGRGALFEAFVRLKEKLEKEGLFDAALKRPLPFLPRRVGIVTSLQAAALRDVLTTFARRNPSIAVLIYPAPVQGEGAGAAIADAIATAGLRRECDVLIICRGGGAIEDLWAFNEEAVARAIRACPIPVVCGVGHETDFTIADFAADRRAPTPTGAAEILSPSRSELLDRVASLFSQLTRRVARDLEVRAQSVDQLSRRLIHPVQRQSERLQLLGQLRLRLARATAQRLDEQVWRVSALAHRVPALLPRVRELATLVRMQTERMASSLQAIHARQAARVASLESSLEHLAPARVLERGYSLVRDSSGRLVRNAANLSVGDPVDITFARGGASASIDSTRG